MSISLLPLVVASITEPNCSSQVTALEPKSWPVQYAVTGTKSEPLYVSRVRLVRDQDWFFLSGGAPAGDAPWRISVRVDVRGSVTGTSGSGVTLVCDVRLPKSSYVYVDIRYWLW